MLVYDSQVPADEHVRAGRNRALSRKNQRLVSTGRGSGERVGSKMGTGAAAGERRRLRGGGADGDAEKGADQKAAEESSRLGIRRGRTRVGEMEDSTGVER